MAILTRMTRLFRADAHALLDRLEEPALLLRQAVREMAAALAEDERRRRLLDGRHTRLRERRAGLERAIATATGELDVCFAAGNEALARGLVRRRLEATRLHAEVERHRDAVERQLAELDARLDEQRARLEAMRQKSEILAGDDAGEGDDDEAWLRREPGAALRVGDDEVEVAFLQEQQRRARS